MPAQSRTPDVVFAGVATWDTVAQLPHLPDPDGRVVAEALSGCGGGPAATAAVTAARLGLAPELVAAVGDDREAALILDGLRADGVGTSSVQTVPGATSGACVVLVDRGRGSRAICVRPGPDLAPVPGSPAAQRMMSAGWLLVDHVGLPAIQRLPAALPPDTRRPVICYDAGNLHPHRCPPEVDVYAPTLTTLRALYGPPSTGREGPDVPALLAAAHADGASVVVATDGARGAVVSGPDGVFAVPGHAGQVRSTLGAGDVFHGAFVTALARGMPLPDALAYANAAAALSCRGLDGRAGIGDDAETRALAARLPASPLVPATAHR